ncbi:MAG: DNA repair exonuclease SbcCD ATPase subunit, partial [Mariniblastus sp.]
NLMYTFKSQQRIEEIIQQRQVIRLEELKLEEQERELASSQEEKQAENASELLATQRAYLQELLVDYKSFDNQLVTEKEALLRLVKDVREARAYIDKQSLWLQSSRPLGFSDLGKLGNAFQSFFNRGKWNDLAVAVKHRVASAPYNAALAGFLLLGMFVVSRRLREQA